MLCYHIFQAKKPEAIRYGGSGAEKGRKRMSAIISEFILELVKLIALIGVSLAAIFCGKKLRDRKDAKKASELSSKDK